MRLILLAALWLCSGCAFLRPSPREPEPQLHESGLVIWDLMRVEGPVAELGDTVLVHYDIELIDGTPIDSSMDQGAPIELVLGETPVIAGLLEGLLGMAESARRRIQIPAELGWGAQGAGPVPPHAILLAQIEIVELRKAGVLDFSGTGESH